MANVKITDLAALTNPASTDVLPIVDVGADVTKKISIADLLENAGSGTASAPGIAFDGDSNTGIYRPGADQLAISTNGSGRLFVDASGNVGVGIASPGRELEVYKDDSQAAIAITASTTGQSSLYFADTADSNIGAISYTHSDNALAFRVNDGERLRITSDGKVGLGTSSPRTLFNIASPTGPSLTIENTETSITGSDTYGSIDWYGNDATTGASGIRAQIQVLSRGSSGECALDFGTSSAGNAIQTRMRIDRTGFVGIGTILPDQLLDIAASTDATIQLKSTKTGAAVNDVLGTIAYYGSDGSGPGAGVKSSITSTAQGTGGAGSDLRFHTTNSAGSNNTEKVRIDEQGNVGIGTTSPSYALEVATNSATSGAAVSALIKGNATGGQSVLLLGDTTNDFVQHIKSDHSDNSLSFHTAAVSIGDNERARIDNLGRLLVGTSTSVNTATSAAASAQIFGSVGSLAIRRGSNDAGGPFLALGKSRSATDGSYIDVRDGDDLGSIRFAGDDGSDIETVGAEIRAFVDGTPGANDMPGRLVFSVTADGASSPTEAMRIKNTRVINFSNAPVYADNAAAKTGGLVDGDVYRTSTGDLKIVYT